LHRKDTKIAADLTNKHPEQKTYNEALESVVSEDSGKVLPV